MSSSSFDPTPVFEAVIQNAVRLSNANNGSLIRIDSGVGTNVAHAGMSAAHVARMLKFYEARPLVPGRSSLTGRVLRGGRSVQIPDTSADPDYDRPVENPMLSLLGVPLRRQAETVGVLIVRRREAGGFSRQQVRLLEAFADQAAIAIENARLFNETKEALERQRAIAEILEVISRSTSDIRPVFDAVVAAAARLTDADGAAVHQRVADELRTVATYQSVVPIGSTIPLDGPHPSARAFREGRSVHVEDVLADPLLGDQPLGSSMRTRLAVPIPIKDGRFGALAVVRRDVRPFTPRQIQLIETFVRQAGIAIENVRLFNETKEALEQQTATRDVLETINKTGSDIDPVLQVGIDRAVRLCHADLGAVQLIDGNELVTRAYHGTHPGMQGIGSRRTLEQKMPVTIAAREARTVHTVDPSVEYRDIVLHQGMAGSRLAVPIVKDGRVSGVFNLLRHEVRAFTDREIAIVETFADQAAIAIENVRLFNETKEALEQQSAVAEVLKTISRSVFDLHAVLDAIIQNAMSLGSADNGTIVRVEPDGTAHFVASAGITEDTSRLAVVASRGPIARDRSSVTGRVLLEEQTVQVEDVLVDPEYNAELKPLTGGDRSILGVPLRRGSQVIGVVLLRRKRPSRFTPAEVAIVETFADQAAIAMENVRLFNEIQDKSQQLEVASRHKSEFLANMSHELRTPLNAIIGFTDVMLQEMFGPLNDKQKEYLEDVRGSGTHLLSLINDILDLSKIEAGRMELETSEFSLSDAIDNALTLVRERASRHGITLAADISPDVGLITADERKVKQVLVNLLSNAVKFTADGGRVGITALCLDSRVEVAVRDTGIGIAPGDQERVFEEFQQVGRDPDRSREGTGLGLTLTKKFVELHGGRIWLESEPGKGSTFTFSLPVRQSAVAPAS